jgi:hypothetical protein
VDNTTESRGVNVVAESKSDGSLEAVVQTCQLSDVNQRLSIEWLPATVRLLNSFETPPGADE